MTSDEDCVFPGLKKFLLVHKFLSLLLNEFLQIMQKSCSVQNNSSIIAVADKYSGAVSLLACGVVLLLIL